MGIEIKQGFLNDDLERSVRIRIVSEDAYITIKGSSTGPVRREFEYPVPKADAEALIEELCIPPPLVKVRYVVEYHGLTWEVCGYPLLKHLDHGASLVFLRSRLSGRDDIS